MRENTLRTLWHSGRPIINGWLTIPSVWSAEVMAHQGWDSVTVDTQHGLIDYQTALTMLTAISTMPVTPLVRVPWNEPGSIMKMLDAGAYGIICPMTSSRAEVEAFVGACRYPPQGYRSYGPTRAATYAGADYFQQANQTILTLAMIETAEAIENVEEILTVPGLDGIYIGPADLGISLGIGPGLDFGNPHLAGPIERVIEAAKQHGKLPGIHVLDVPSALLWLEKGAGLVSIASDTRLLSQAASHTVNAVKQNRDGAMSTGLY